MLENRQAASTRQSNQATVLQTKTSRGSPVPVLPFCLFLLVLRWSDVFGTRTLVAGNFFFVFSELLLDFLNRSIQSIQYSICLSRGDKILCMFSRNVNFYVRLLLMLKIDHDRYGVDSVKDSPNLFRFVPNDLLIVVG